MAQVYDEPIVVRLTQPVGPYPVGTEFGFRDVADAIRALGSANYFTVVRTQDGDPIPPPTPEDLTEAEKQALARARAARLIRGKDFDPLVGNAAIRHGAPLDIWPAFDATGSGDGWVAATYADWLAGVDAHFAPDVSAGRVTRQVRATDGAGNPIVAYSSGPATKPVAMIVSGVHGERIGQRAAMRFFEGFVRSDHPVMAQLRDTFRLVWIVTVTPSAYPVNRLNTNGVDINRNFGFWHDKFASTPSTPKGPSEFSEVETQAVRDLVLAEKPSLFIDCHNYGSGTGQELAYSEPSGYVLGAQRFIHTALRQWDAVYNADGEMTLAGMPRGEGRDPSSKNWAQYAMRWLNGNTRSAAVTLECTVDLFGSTPEVTSRKAMQAYCGAIATILTSWISAGQSVTEYPYTYSLSVSRSTQSTPTSIAAGGVLIDQGNYVETAYTFTNAAPVQWDGAKSRMEIVVPYAPANVVLTVTGEVFSGADTTSAGNIHIEPRLNGQASQASRQTISVSAEPSKYYPFATSRTFRIDEVSVTNPPYVELIVWREQGSMTRRLQRVTMTATVTPHTSELGSFRVY